MSALGRFLIAIGIILAALAVPAGLYIDGPPGYPGSPSPTMDLLMIQSIILLIGGTALLWAKTASEQEAENDALLS